MSLRWTQAAARHLEEIGDHVALDKPAAADRLLRRIIAEAGTLSTHPEIGRAGRIDGTRELIVSGTPYIVVYRSRNGAVEILAVFHGARRWPDRLTVSAG